MGILTHNFGYNITHVQGGLSFENALLDAAFWVKENPGQMALLGGFDEMSAYNFNIDRLAGWYKTLAFSGEGLYQTTTEGSIAGEGMAMFLVNDQPQEALAEVLDSSFFFTQNREVMEERFLQFLQKNNCCRQNIDLFFSGENGDIRMQPFYETIENNLTENTAIARHKHLTGEYPTASALALAMMVEIIALQQVPPYLIKKWGEPSLIRKVLYYNCFKGNQHSFLLVQGVG